MLFRKRIKPFNKLFKGFTLTDVLTSIANNDYIPDWIVNVYFVGGTLGIDIRTKKLKDVITITSTNTVGLFINSDKFERRDLTPDELKLVETIRMKLKK